MSLLGGRFGGEVSGIGEMSGMGDGRSFWEVKMTSHNDLQNYLPK